LKEADETGLCKCHIYMFSVCEFKVEIVVKMEGEILINKEK